MREFHRSVHVATLLFALLSNSWLSYGTIFAQPQATEPPGAPNEVIVPITANRTQLELVEKFTKVLETKNRIIRVNGFDPQILSVTALTPHRISVSGQIQGVTSFILTDETDANFTVEIFVKGDARALQMLIDRKFPNSSIEVFKVMEAVALRGWVTQSEHITQIVEFAEQFYPKVLNHMKVGGVQQVLLKVKVMEAQRSLIRELGMNFTYLSRSGYANSQPGNLTTLGDVTFSPLGFKAVNKDLTGSFGLIGNNSIFDTYISALHDESLLKVLAEPEMLAANGRPATMLSGGEFPIIVPQSLGTVSIQWREFGVRLEAVPFVLGGGSLRLDLQPEVSERDFANAVTIGGTTVPGLTVRRVNTQVEMKFGQTLMLAGLISKRQTTTTHKVPFLGELPYLGAAFRRVHNEDSETEVVITVTPELVAPLDDSQVPEGGPGRFTESPTDRELFGYGLLEVPKMGDRCVNCAPGQSGPVIVPGLKEPLHRSTVPPAPAAGAPDRKELLAPPTPVDSETTERARRFAVQMAAKQRSQSGVRQAAHNEAPPKPRTREATRAPAPQSADRPEKEASTRSTNPVAVANRSNLANDRPITEPKKSNTDSQKTTTASSTNPTRKNKPGLIEPPAR